MTPHARTFAAALAAAALLGACGGGDDTASDSTEATETTVADETTTSGDASSDAVVVVAKDLAFKPSPATAAVGQKVQWRFEDGSIPHNVSGDGFKSEDKTTGTYEHTFDKAGTYKYVCTIHPGMNGEVVVQ